LLDDYRARRAAGYLKAGFRRLRFSRRTYAAGSSVRVNPAVVPGSGRHSSLGETVSASTAQRGL
jgi:hypothetical protein